MTFGQKDPILNSSPVYCSWLYCEYENNKRLTMKYFAKAFWRINQLKFQNHNNQTINWPNDLIFSSSTYLLCLKLHNCTFIDTHYMHRCIDLTELMTCYIFFLCLTINSNQESKWLLNVNCKLLDGLIFFKNNNC